MTDKVEGYKNEIILLEQGSCETKEDFMHRVNQLREDSDMFDICSFGCRAMYEDDSVSKYYLLVAVATFVE